MVSIGQVIGESVYEDDFRREFGPVDGAVAVDLYERFSGWKLGIVESMAIKPADVWELLDGVIVYKVYRIYINLTPLNIEPSITFKLERQL